MTDTRESHIQSMRERAALLELEAAELRLKTAQAEHDSSKQVCYMAEQLGLLRLKREEPPLRLDGLSHWRTEGVMR